jgi:hypothetical protein
MNTPVVKPWYREPWPWILMSGPAIVVVAGIYTAWLAIDSNDGLVDDDYYKQGLAVSQRMARDNEASGLGLVAEIVVGGNGQELRLFLTARESAVLPEVLVLRLVHPTKAGADQAAKLKRDSAGFYVGSLASPVRGRWHASLEDEGRKWRITGDWNSGTESTLRLPGAVKKPTIDQKGR